MANGVWHSVLKRVLELDKEDLGLPGSSGISASDVLADILRPLAERPRDLLLCVENSLHQKCKAELRGVKSPHMYVRRHRGPDGVLRLRAAHLPTGHEVTPEEGDRHKAMKDFLARHCQSAGIESNVETTTKLRTSRPDVTIIGNGGLSLGCEAQFYNASPSLVLRRTRAHHDAGLVTNWITHNDTFHLVDRANWMLIRDVTWREISNADDLPLVGGYRVLASWHCTAAAERPCPTGLAKTGCGKRHLQWDTPRRLDGEAAGWTGHRGDQLGTTVGRTVIGAATGNVVPLFVPGRKDYRAGNYMWVPAQDRDTWEDYRGTPAPADEHEPEDNQYLHFSGRDADTTCRFGEETWHPSAPLPRRGITSVELTLTVEEPTVPQQRLPEKQIEQAYGSSMAETPFPDDLCIAQTRLHQATAELTALGRTLPWSVEPHEGWPGKEHSHTGEVTGGRPPSPGWTDEQKAAVSRLRQECLILSKTVATHPYWQSLSGEDLVRQRMELKSITRPQAAAALDVTAAA
ncbi:hypothetical protein [Streptomyces nitrosporeus]|uniref:competence protein CoiA family protein n=1 Tax=Streptomyces nitrosporeus TaxID=28894 RepID=UPI0039A040BC